MKEKLSEGGIIPGRRNSLDKGPVLGLKEAHPIWSPESERSRVGPVEEVGQQPDHTELCRSWKDFGIYIRASPKAEGLLSSLFSPILSLPLLPSADCIPFPGQVGSQPVWPLLPALLFLLLPSVFVPNTVPSQKDFSEVTESSHLNLHIRNTRPWDNTKAMTDPGLLTAVWGLER